jgi:hypothetical protein
VTTVSDVNLYYYTAAYSISEERGEDWLHSWPDRVEELSARLDQRVAPGQDVFSAMRRQALDELKQRPSAYLRVQVKSGFKLFVDHSLGTWYEALGSEYKPSGFFSRAVLRNPEQASSGNWGGIIAAAGWMGGNGLIALAALVGMVRGGRTRHYALTLGAAVTVVLFTVATASVGLEAKRLPMMLPLFLLAAFAVAGPARAWAMSAGPKPVGVLT